MTTNKDGKKVTVEDLADMSQENLEGQKKVEKQEEVSTKSGVDLFLEANEYNPELMPFGENEKGEPITKNFHELDSAVQKNILDSLTKEQGVKLSEVEEADLSVLRENKMSLEEFTNDIAELKVNEYAASVKKNTIDIESMSDKEIFSFFSKRSDKDITDESVDEKFSLLEESGGKDTKINNIKELLEEEKNIKISNAKNELQKKTTKIIESERGSIADIASSIDTIGGWNVSKDSMNETLDRIMDTVTDGEGNTMSKFQDEVMSDPEQMIKAEWYLKNGDLYFQRMEKFYKDKMIDMYNKGKDSVLKGDTVEDKEAFFKQESSKKENEKEFSTQEDLID